MNDYPNFCVRLLPTRILSRDIYQEASCKVNSASGVYDSG